MSNLFARLTNIKTDDPNIKRRGRMVIVISIGMAIVCLLLLIAAAIEGAAPLTETIMAGTAVLLIGNAFLARTGEVRLTGKLVIAITILLNLALMALNPATPSLPFFLVLALLQTMMLLPPKRIWPILIFCMVGNILVIALFSPDLRTSALWFEIMVNSSVLISAVAFIGYLSAREIRTAQSEAYMAREQTEVASQTLANSNLELEARVKERTATLSQLTGELQASLQAQQELNQILADLVVPVIPINADTLVVPLIGNIDSARSEQVLSAVLERIEREHARTVVVDVTGVTVIDTQVAGSLIRLASATRLMGTSTVLTGIRPDVAQTLVYLGVELTDLRTYATLEESLR
jgi:rsbT co-antagonist protein RsbR